MQYARLILLLGTLLCCNTIRAQEVPGFDEVNSKSYELYEKGDWKSLLRYGRDAITHGQDFLLLRLRTGYAAFMLNNFSEALKQYDAAIKEDSYNATAHYYSWMCRRYLNQNEFAGIHVKYFSAEIAGSQKKDLAITNAGIESSYKTSDISSRSGALYSRFNVHMRLEKNVYMHQSIAFYNQTISEKKLQEVTNNTHINIRQVEYYNKLLLNLNESWQLKIAYHYLYTPYNNFIYNNHVGLLALKYYSHYFDVQADAILAKLTDSTIQQYNVHLGLYPLGNLNLYGFTTATFRPGSAILQQVLGFKISKGLWLELHSTFGKFSDFLENDALYVYNAIDENRLKSGGLVYFAVSPKWLVQLGYTFEQRMLYNTSQTFSQHSITGGLSWKL